jgi:hypothetical protein
MPAKKSKIALIANTSWYVYNFRLSLIRSLIEADYDVVVLSPPDEYSAKITARGVRVVDLPMNNKGMNPIEDFGPRRAILSSFAAGKARRFTDVHHQAECLCIARRPAVANSRHQQCLGTRPVVYRRKLGYCNCQEAVPAGVAAIKYGVFSER